MLSSRRKLSVKKQTPSQQERQSPGGVTALTSKTGGNLEPSSCICSSWKLALQEEGNGGGGQKALAGVLGGCGGEEQGKTGVFLCPVRQQSYFCRSSWAPDKVWIVPVLDAGANTWADSWILRSSQCPSKRVKGILHLVQVRGCLGVGFAVITDFVWESSGEVSACCSAALAWACKVCMCP